MNRSGYNDDCDDILAAGRWTGRVQSAIRGRRGQAFLREFLAALDAMPEKALIADHLEADGQFCALGVAAHAKGLDIKALFPFDDEEPDDDGYMDGWDEDTWERLGSEFNIAECLAREVMYHNDETVSETRSVRVVIAGPMRPGHPHWEHHERWESEPVPDASQRRWAAVRAWVASQIKAATATVTLGASGTATASGL